MKPKIFFGIILFVLISLCLTIPAWAVESSNPNAEQSYFTLEVNGNLINLQAEQASFKEILFELERGGIKVKIIRKSIEGKSVVKQERFFDWKKSVSI